ncbi:hypothetical protein O9H85_13775 [Paenibacillus filicis]|uniref:PilZ domain-containing protein n=1 Tax=Paenibacillus gyeongsangnamensis TaxID=3388067 RepID=A0ABT4Q9I2_9BACL|nr:hypothetical protein [Paenibacillus filicis]MCZ8513481.1 hypothetical protein [Paenibacillus filicis]
MKDIQMLHKGKIVRGQITYDQTDLLEVKLDKTDTFRNGEEVTVLGFERKHQMRVLRVTPFKVLFAPADSEVFQIDISKDEAYEDLVYDDSKKFTSFRLNTYATISEDFRTFAVRVTDVSRLGFGFEINDFSVKMNHVYDSMIICDEVTIHPKLVVRYAHILEKTIRYGAEIHHITPGDLSRLRYYIVTRQFVTV